MASGVRTIKFPGRRLDSGSGAALGPLMATAWQDGATAVALDLSSVVYIDSLGISVLISQYRKRPPEGKIVLCALTDYVRDVLEVTQLFRIFDAFDSVEAAAAALG